MKVSEAAGINRQFLCVIMDLDATHCRVFCRKGDDRAGDRELSRKVGLKLRYEVSENHVRGLTPCFTRVRFARRVQAFVMPWRHRGLLRHTDCRCTLSSPLRLASEGPCLLFSRCSLSRRSVSFPRASIALLAAPTHLP